MTDTPSSTSSTFARLIGLALMAFGGFLVYSATAAAQRLTGGGFVAVALALMLPAQVQLAGQILVGIGRSAGLIKKKPTHHKPGEKPKLGETVSAHIDDLDLPPKP